MFLSALFCPKSRLFLTKRNFFGDVGCAVKGLAPQFLWSLRGYPTKTQRAQEMQYT